MLVPPIRSREREQEIRWRQVKGRDLQLDWQTVDFVAVFGDDNGSGIGSGGGIGGYVGSAITIG